MSYSYSDPPCTALTRPSTLQKLYQAFIISIPLSTAFVVLLFFYLCYLRRQRADWSSIRMRAPYANNNHDLSRSGSGLKKELREMLPIIVYKESFSVKDTQCSVCLADYEAEDRLQQIPACGHTFHMDCIDHWLTTHTTCPLCRLSLLPPGKSSTELQAVHVETSQEEASEANSDGAPRQERPRICEETQAIQVCESSHGDARISQDGSIEDARNSTCADSEREFRSSTYDTEQHEPGHELYAWPISGIESV